MRVEAITTREQLSALVPHWRQLAGDHPMRGPAWLETWWRYYGGGPADLLVLAARDGLGRLTGVAPWYVEATSLRGRVVRFLGSGEVCSDHLSLVCRPGLEGRVAAAFAAWLLPHENGSRPREQRWDLLELDAVDASDMALQQLVEACAQRGGLVDRQPAAACWRLPLPGTWEDYLARLSKSHRKRVRRLSRTYFESGRARVCRVELPRDLDRGFETLLELHNLRRLGHSGNSGFTAVGYTHFHRAACRHLLSEGQLRLAWIELDGRSVAAEYQLVGSDTIFAYQSGMDPSAAAHQPGNLSIIGTIREAIDAGCTAVDFMRGDEEYKAHWRATPHPCRDLRVRPGRTGDRLRRTAWKAARGARAWIRAGRELATACLRRPSGEALKKTASPAN